MSSEVRPSTISSEISSPVTGACMMPCPEKPAALMKPSTPSTFPRIGCLSGVSSYSPAHPVLIEVRSRMGNRDRARSTTDGMKSQLTLSSNAGFAGARDIAVQHAGGIGVAVLRAERTEAHVVGARVFEERFGLGRGHPPRGDAEACPHGERALERVCVAVFGD